MTRRLSAVATLTAAVLLLGSCGGDPLPPDKVAFVGTLIQQRFVSTDPVLEIPAASVFVTGSGGTTLLGSSVTDDVGGFVAGGLPKDVSADLVFSKSPSFARSVFPTNTESRDSLLFFGTVFEATVDDANGIVAEYATAAGLSSGDLMTFDSTLTTSTAGAMVRGRIIKVTETPDGVFLDPLDGAHVEVKDASGTSYRVFYRGDPPNGNSPGPILPAATVTGLDSRFVAFGVKAQGLSSLPFEAGKITITVTTSNGTFTQETIGVLNGITEPDYFTAY